MLESSFEMDGLRIKTLSFSIMEMDSPRARELFVMTNKRSVFYVRFLINFGRFKTSFCNSLNDPKVSKEKKILSK